MSTSAGAARPNDPRFKLLEINPAGISKSYLIFIRLRLSIYSFTEQNSLNTGVKDLMELEWLLMLSKSLRLPLRQGERPRLPSGVDPVRLLVEEGSRRASVDFYGYARLI